MKYCAQCGTQISDDTMVCPKCHPEINNQQPHISSNNPPPQKKKSNKIFQLVLTNTFLTSAILISNLFMYFNPPSTSGSTNNTTNTPTNQNNIISNSSNSYNSTTCPENEHGNHDWNSPTCSYPARCFNCGEYKDNTLGHHSFYTDDNGICDCSYCGILYEVYMDSLD